MLTEGIVVSSLRPDKIPSHIQNKDVGVYFYDLQPSVSLRATLKKSSTQPNCLAFSRTHAFAAQVDKAAVHVYNLAKGNQECLVPFPEKITSLALIGGHHDLGVLALGTQGGNVIFWELATGRQLATQAAHLQSIPCLVVDPTQNFLISGSPDSNVLVWSIPACLSFASTHDAFSDQASPFSPIQTLSNHRGPVTCLAAGHSFSTSNFVISGSEDRSCIVWDYRTGHLLHTFLLSFTPLCLAVDPADRAFYAGCPDGGIQLVDFYKRPRLENVVLSSTAADAATEASAEDKWPSASSEPSATLSIALSYDGTRAFSGHRNGQLHAWEVATGKIAGEKMIEVLGALTNIAMQPVRGLARADQAQARLVAVVKPKRDSPSNASDRVGAAPEDYALSAQFHRPLATPRVTYKPRTCRGRNAASDPAMDDFSTALSHVSLPPDLLEEEMVSVLSPDPSSQPRGAASLTPGRAEQEVKQLSDLLAASSHSYLAMKDTVDKLTDEVLRLRQEGQDRQRRRRVLQARRLQAPSQTDLDGVNGRAGTAQGDESMDED